MKQILFLSVITISFLFTIGACTNHSGSSSGTQVQNINNQEFTKIAQQADAIIIDVRTPGEVAEGIIKGTSIIADINGGDFEQKMEQLDKSKTYLIYCRSGNRSSTAAEYMLNKGFTKVYNLEGGITNWTGEIIKP